MKYIFWEQYDCKKISGLPKMILMGVKALSVNHDVALISSPTSLVYKILKDENITFQFIPESALGNNDIIDSEDIIILPNFGPKDLILHKYNPKVIFWHIYGSMCISGKLQKYIVRNQMARVLKCNAFVAMDVAASTCISKELGIHLPCPIIPMPIDHLEYRYQPSLYDHIKRIKISYLGRAVSWKAFAVIKLLQDAAKIKDRLFELHIITDSENLFSNLIDNHIPDNVNIFYHEGLFGNKMLDLMCQMDMHLAMGISTLEGAALGIPTLTAPYSTKIIPDYYKFHWLYEDVDNYAGSPINEEYVNKIGHSFEEIISSLSNNTSLKEISLKCYQCASQFSLESIAEKIEKVPTSLHIRSIHYRMGSFWKSKIRHLFGIQSK